MTKKAMQSVYLDRELKKRLVEEAEKQNRSTNNYIELVLKKHIEDKSK